MLNSDINELTDMLFPNKELWLPLSQDAYNQKIFTTKEMRLKVVSTGVAWAVPWIFTLAGVTIIVLTILFCVNFRDYLVGGVLGIVFFLIGPVFCILDYKIFIDLKERTYVKCRFKNDKTIVYFDNMLCLQILEKIAPTIVIVSETPRQAGQRVFELRKIFELNIIKCDKTRVQVLMNENFDIVKMYAEKLSREMSLPYISFLL